MYIGISISYKVENINSLTIVYFWRWIIILIGVWTRFISFGMFGTQRFGNASAGALQQSWEELLFHARVCYARMSSFY